MKLYKIRLCGTNSWFRGIQGFLKNDQRSLTLSMMGEGRNCEDILLEDDVWLTTIKFTYNSSGINFFTIKLSDGREEQRGQPTQLDKEYVSNFTEYQRVAGFVGYKKGDITALGSYRYMCDEPPPVEPTDPVDEDDTEDEEEPVDNDNKTDVPDPNDPLDPDYQKDDHEPKIIEVTTEDDSNNMTVVLIVLVCVLLPLVGILCYVVHLFRKNKKNAVAAAMGRRRSSVNLRANYQRSNSLKRSSVALDDDKMENQGKDINIMPEDDEKMPVIPATEIGVMAMFTQIPTDQEIKELLKGKTAKEKRMLLKEIEKAKQQRIHLEYLLEQQKIKNDEKWAMRNVEERQALENLVNQKDAESAKAALLKNTNAVIDVTHKDEFDATHKDQLSEYADNSKTDAIDN